MHAAERHDPIVVSIGETNRLGAADFVRIEGHPSISDIQLSTDYNVSPTAGEALQGVPHVVFHLSKPQHMHSPHETAALREGLINTLRATGIAIDAASSPRTIRLAVPDDLPDALSALGFDCSSQCRIEGLYTEVQYTHRTFRDRPDSYPQVRALVRQEVRRLNDIRDRTF